MTEQVEWRFVFSTYAKRVGYNHDTTELLVEYPRSGKISAYGPDFPYVEFDKVSKSVSVGRMIRTEVAPKYNHRYFT